MALGDFNMSTFSIPNIRNFQLEELTRLNAQIEWAAQANSAGAFVGHIAQQVRAFESALDSGSEVGAYLVSFGQAVTVHVSSILAVEPSLIVIEGRVADGEPVRLVQHVSQISFLLVKVKRLSPDEPRQPIGFQLQETRP